MNNHLFNLSHNKSQRLRSTPQQGIIIQRSKDHKQLQCQPKVTQWPECARFQDSTIQVLEEDLFLAVDGVGPFSNGQIDVIVRVGVISALPLMASKAWDDDDAVFGGIVPRDDVERYSRCTLDDLQVLCVRLVPCKPKVQGDPGGNVIVVALSGFFEAPSVCVTFPGRVNEVWCVVFVRGMMGGSERLHRGQNQTNRN
jgi:hypothetical protein